MTGYTLARSRRKTLAIHVKPDGSVEIRAPLRLAKSEIERFVAAKWACVEKKQAQIAAWQPAAPQALPPPQYESGEFERVARELASEWGWRGGHVRGHTQDVFPLGQLHA